MKKGQKIVEFVTVFSAIFIVSAIGLVALGVSVKAFLWILAMLGVI